MDRKSYGPVPGESKWWKRVYTRVFWGGVDDEETAKRLLALIRDDFTGKLLDVPAGIGEFTADKFKAMKKAQITCLVPGKEIFAEAQKRFEEKGVVNATLLEGNCESMPFGNESFDIVLSMNGFHSFVDKENAYEEVLRVLKPGGRFVACFYVKGKSSRTDWLVSENLSKQGWFRPPFETEDSLRERLEKNYKIESFEFDGPMVRFLARKRKVQPQPAAE